MTTDQKVGCSSHPERAENDGSRAAGWNANSRRNSGAIGRLPWFERLARCAHEIVAINRAAAKGELDGPGAGLLARCGRSDDADAAYKRAIELTDNPVERRFLNEQRASAQRPV